MARQEVDIGVEGNDGTGDSIRESFRKVNENFKEIYAVVGKGGQITFTLLADTPDDLAPYAGDGNTAYIPMVTQDGTAIEIRRIGSNAIDESEPTGTSDTISIKVSQSGDLILKTNSVKISQDTSPRLGGPLNAAGAAIANVGTTQEDLENLNNTHETDYTIDDLVIDKKFADQNYIIRQLPGEEILVPDEPEDAQLYSKTLGVIDANNRIPVTSHGFSKGSNGKAFVLRTTSAGLNWSYSIRNPLTNELITINQSTPGNSPLVDGDFVFINVYDTNTLEFYLTREHALETDQDTREELRLKVTRIDQGSVIQIVDADFDATLEGFFLSTQAMPRKSIVRRQGDTMEGALILHDHPGDLAGTGTPNGITDKQAVTKLYVDSQSTESSTNIYVSSVGDDSQFIAPPGKEGSSLAYAFRTIGAACRKAEQINLSSPFEPGPYMQDIIYTRQVIGSPPIVTKSQISDSGVITDAGLGTRSNAKKVVDANIEFIVAEVLEWVRQRIAAEETTNIGTILGTVSVNWTDRVINERRAELELIKSINAASLDHVSGLTATILSTRVGLEFYNDEYEKAQAGITKDVYATMLDRVKTVISNVVSNDPAVPFEAQQSIYTQTFIADLTSASDVSSYGSENGKIQLQIDIVTGGVFSIVDNIDIKGRANTPGNKYLITFTNGLNDFVDQGNPQNTDLRTGKVIRGKTSGALGRIVTYTQGFAVDDSAEIDLLTPTEFIKGENLEFGNLVNNRQITIRVETGQYEEDYPIRVPSQTSLVGDEMRRVIVRPRKRTSQSPWSGVYFYRDAEFDGLRGDTDSITGIADPNIPSNGEPYYDPLLNPNPNPLIDPPTGYFGRHYLVDPNSRKNIDNGGQLLVGYGTFPNVEPNLGGYIPASVLIEKNKEFIVEEVIAFIDERVARPVPPTGYIITWTDNERDRYRRKLGTVLDFMAQDLREGGNLGVLEAQGDLFFESQEYPDEEVVTEQSLTYIGLILDQVLINQAFVRAPEITVGAAHPAQYINANLVVDSNVYSSEGIKNSQLNLLKFAFNQDYNPAKRSIDTDVFLMNDATIIRNMSITGHGGFMTVLDPEGQILTKSPYIQTGSSFSQSLNRQAFRGGMLVDAFCANTPLRVVNVIDQWTIEVTADAGSGLAERKPQTPAPFYINGVRYQVNDIPVYNDGGIDGDPSATLVLDRSSGPANPALSGSFLGWNIPLPVGGYDITLQTAGNRSQLGNDFTQVNDLGYGLVTINGGLSEMVSMFTYYCHTAYYAGNGGQIRSTNGSNCNGVYGLVAVGSDPNEVPDSVVLDNDMSQSALTFSAEIVLELDAALSLTAGDIISNAASNPTAYARSVFSSNGKKVYLYDVRGSFAQGNSIFTGITFTDYEDPQTGTGGTDSTLDVQVLDTTGYTNLTTQLSMYVYETEYVPNNKGEIDFFHSDVSINGRYELANVEVEDGIIVDGYTIDSTEYTFAGVSRGVDIGGIPGNTEILPTDADTQATLVIQKISKNGGQYKVNIWQGDNGDHYKVGDTFTILGSQLAGTDTTHDAVVTVTEVNRSAINIQNNIQTGSIRRMTVSGTPNVIAGYTPQRDGQVYKLNFSTSNDQFDNDGLISDIPLNETVTIRANQTHLFREVESVNDLTIRPSTAVNFDDDPEDTYRSISFGVNDSAGNPLFDDQTLTGFDASYDFIRLNIAAEYVDLPINKIGTSTLNGTTLGDTVGDTTIAIDLITEVRDHWRLNNNFFTSPTYQPDFTDDNGKVYPYTGELPKVIDWRGKKHYVYNYREVEYNAVSTNYDETQIWQETNSFALVDLKEISEVTLTLNIEGTWARDDGETNPQYAIIRQSNNTSAFGYVKIAGELSTEITLFEWSGVNFNTTGSLQISYDGGIADWTTLVNPIDGVTAIVPVAQDARDSNLTTVTGDGIAEPVTPSSTQAVVLRAGLQEGSPAKITIQISTCRATGHDFLDIGTGSFNQTNYPNVLLGFPATEPNQQNEVQERNKGRVFYVSTDQDGFFRVGRFFTVDQGTGTVTFAASIALSDVDGIGFKRGVVVTEFSTDTSMSDNAIDSVPVESAVRGYVSRRLGYDQAGNAVSNPIGPSVLTQNGAVPLTGNLSAGGNTITNIAPVDLALSGANDAVPRSYVDSRAELFNKAKALRDVEIDTAAAHQLLGFTGVKMVYLSAPTISVGADFSTGRVITNSVGSKLYGVIKSSKTYYDNNFGDVVVITFEPGPDSDEFTEVATYTYNDLGSGTFSISGVTIYEGTANYDVGGVLQSITVGGDAEAINGPFPEIINIAEEPFDNGSPVSDIGFTTRRVETNDNPGDGLPDDPTAYINLQINDEVIVNQDVSPTAGILQSKLSMQEADVFVTNASDVLVIDGVEIEQGITYEIVNAGTVDFTSIGAADSDTGTQFVATNDGVSAGLAGAGSTVKRVLTAINIQTLVDDTRPNNQAELGLSKFDGAHFKVTRGHVQLKDNGITLDKIEKLASDTVIGNSQGVEANCAEVTFNTVVNEGGGILHTDMSYTNSEGVNAVYLASGTGANASNAGVITRTGSETYAVVPDTTIGTKNSYVKTSSTGNITASTISIGQNSSYVVLETFDTNGLTIKTPQGATVLTAQYDAASTAPVVYTPSSINIGNLTDPDGPDAGTDPDVFAQSSLQAAATALTGTSWIASRWAYHSFIESPVEKGAATTGIAIGAGSGKADVGEIALIVGNSDNNTSPVVAKFSKTGIVPDSSEAYGIGTTNLRYGDSFFKSITTTNNVSASGAVTAGTSISSTTTMSSGGNFSVATDKFTVSSSTGDTVVGGTLQVGSTIKAASTGIDIGESGTPFDTIYGNNFTGTAATAKFADLAENYVADEEYEPGTVVVFGGEFEVTKCTTKGDFRVAGVVSTAPGYLMNSHQEGEFVAPIALQGRVPCKVIGVVRKGDMLVTSAVPGYAIVNNTPTVGTVIGKALGNKDGDGKGIVEVVVGRV